MVFVDETLLNILNGHVT